MATQASTGSSYSGPSPKLQAQYTGEYNTALSLNQQNYQNILNQYGAIQSNTGAGAAGVSQGYGTLGQQVQQTIQGIGASQLQAIQDAYAQQSGQLGQTLVQRGLGNTTVASQLQRGVTLDEQKAQVALANQLAQLSAGYQASLGGAGLQAQLQGVGLQAQTGNTLLGTLGNYKTPYPSWPPNSSTSQNRSQGLSGGPGSIGNMNGGAFGPGNLWAGGQGGGAFQPYAPPPPVPSRPPGTFSANDQQTGQQFGAPGFQPNILNYGATNQPGSYGTMPAQGPLPNLGGMSQYASNAANAAGQAVGQFAGQYAPGAAYNPMGGGMGVNQAADQSGYFNPYGAGGVYNGQQGTMPASAPLPSLGGPAAPEPGGAMTTASGYMNPNYGASGQSAAAGQQMQLQQPAPQPIQAPTSQNYDLGGYGQDYSGIYSGDYSGGYGGGDVGTYSGYYG